MSVTEYAGGGGRRGRRCPWGDASSCRAGASPSSGSVPGPGAPTLLLLHGWIASAGLNWFQTFDALGEHYRVLALDHRGHGRGLRSLAAVPPGRLRRRRRRPARRAGHPSASPSATRWAARSPSSSGTATPRRSGPGPLRHRPPFVPVQRERFIFTTAMAAPAGTTRVGQWADRLPPGGSASSRWSRPCGLGPADLAAALGGGRDAPPRPPVGARGRHAIGNYNAKRWIGEVDVPTSVLVTTEDRAIVPERQLALAEAIPAPPCTRWPTATSPAPASFAAPLLAACQDVAARVVAPAA